MTPEAVLTIFQQALEVMVVLILVLLIPALLVGLLVAMFQAATQINEMTLTFIPKLLVMFVVLVLLGPWTMRLLVDFLVRLIGSIPTLVG